jgi:hypothetical protein
MRNIKSYRLFESIDDKHWDIHDIFLELFDEFGYEVPKHVQDYPSLYNISLYSRRLNSGIPSINIENSYCFGAKCLKIRFSSSSNRYLKKGAFKNFEGLNNDKYSSMLQECHLRTIDFLKPIDFLVGSIGVYNIDLDLIYFYETPNFKRYEGVEIYGSNIAVNLEKLDIDLYSNSRHSNGFEAYSNFNIKGMFYLMSYYDGYFYNGEISEKDDNKRYNSELLDWIDYEWSEVCKNLKIKDFQKVNIKNPKIIVAEFLSILKKNQNNYEKFKNI